MSNSHHSKRNRHLRYHHQYHLFQLLTLLCIVPLSYCTNCHRLDAPGRSGCLVVYFYLRRADVYDHQKRICKTFGGKLARIGRSNQQSLVKHFPDFVLDPDAFHSLQPYFIGARKYPDEQFRWEEGPTVGNFDDSEETMGTFLRSSDRGRGDLCLALDSSGQWTPVPCFQRQKAVCQLCVVPRPPLDSCSTHCVYPGGRVTCKTTRGQCPHPGFFGRSHTECNTRPCPMNRWGEGCVEQCNCQPGVACDVKSGHCEGQCQRDWYGDACNKTLCGHPNHWGFDCLSRCYCRGHQPCHPSNGDCLNGCLDGAYGGSCTESTCPEGRFGKQCDKACHCERGSKCSQKDGICFSETCSTGEGGANPDTESHWKSRSCNETKCPVGSYSRNCNRYCACAKGQQCDYMTGKCPGQCRSELECPTVWHGPTCSQTMCPAGRWNPPTCDRTCLELCGSDTCHPCRGHCLEETVVIPRVNCKEPNKFGIDCAETCSHPNCKVCDRWDGDKCLECDKAFEISENTCVLRCTQTKIWGTFCDKPCNDKNCFHCARENGAKCIRCSTDYVVNHDNSCSKECLQNSVWGTDCNKKCYDPSCVLCSKHDGVQCFECAVAFILQTDGETCTQDQSYRHFNTKQNVVIHTGITWEYSAAVLCETVLLLMIYFVCGCHTRAERLLEKIDGERNSEKWKKLVTLNKLKNLHERIYDDEEKKLIKPEGLKNDEESEWDWEEELDEYHKTLEENTKREKYLEKQREGNKLFNETAKMRKEADEYKTMEARVKGPEADPNWKKSFRKMRKCP